MNRKTAMLKSTTGELSIGELRKMITAARGRGGVSKVNRSLALEIVLDIYEGALAGRGDAEIPAGMKEDVYRSGRMKPTRDSLIIQNILRDCG